MALPRLAVSDVVSVAVNLSPAPAANRNFGSMLILGSSEVVNVSERIRQYSTLDQVASDFGLNTPEYLAADLYFSQAPQPNLVYIGRWAQADSRGKLFAAPLDGNEQLLANFTSVTTGAFFIRLAGRPYGITGIDFSSATNLNMVASLVQAQLPFSTTFVWDSTNSRFIMTAPSSGPISTISYADLPTAVGSFHFTVNPTDGDTITLNSVVVTFKNTLTTGNQIQIGATLVATLQNAVTFLTASFAANIILCTYNTVGTDLYLVRKVPGSGGNAFTIAASAATASGATLSGGAGVDISALLGLSLAAGASVPVNGIAAETFLAATQILAGISTEWYALTPASSPYPGVDDLVQTAEFIEGAGLSHLFCVTEQDPLALDPLSVNDLGAQLNTLKLKRTLTQYCSPNPYAVASLFGRQATVDFSANNTVITLKFKQEPGVGPESLSETQAQALKTKKINVYVNYNNDTAIVQEGTMANGYFIDEVVGADWLQYTIQSNVFNLFYQSLTKIPQTDAGTHQIVTAINKACDQGVNNGLIAPGVWNAGGFGTLKTGDTLATGYYVYAPLIATQAQADREARRAPTIQVAVKFAGAIHFSNVLVNVNR